MNSKELGEFLRSLVDENDKTFLTDAQLGAMFYATYNQFRRLVVKQDPSVYEVNYNVAAPNANFLNLDGVLLGATPTQTRAEQITRVLVTDGAAPTPNVLYKLDASSNYENLTQKSWGVWGTTCWWLQNRVLRFNNVVAVPLQIQYIPAAPYTIAQWTAGLTTGFYVDDLIATEFGDLLVLMLIETYKIKDFAQNPYQQSLLKDRREDLRAYLGRGRSGDGADYISSSDW